MQSGTRLGPYEIVALIGAGGMGEVYRARDTRLGRDVAIKVLPAAVAADPERLRRFEREARSTAALSHPNVLAIHDVGLHEGMPYLVEELLEGESLAERLVRGSLPVSEAVRVGVEIARGLAAAHGKEIVHRDLKPGNVFLTAGGTVKLLDFGLAKLVARAASPATIAQATTAAESTELGVLLGTASYMAPEQARGQAVDQRADVLAFGVVLYEMLAGRRPFQGATTTETLAAILRDEPAQLPGDVPAPLAAVVATCLAKEPGQRYQRGSELRAALEAVQAGTAPAPGPRRAVARPARRWLLGVAALAVVAAVLVVLDAGGVRGRFAARPWAPARAVRLAVMPFANLAGDPEQEYLGDGLTQELIAQLGRLHPAGLNVIARSSVMRYKNGDTPVDEIGRELGVAFVLEGSARREADRVRVTAELVDARDQTQLWAATYEREPAGLPALGAEVAREVARRLGVTLTPEEERRLTGAHPVEPRVYEAYLRGTYHVSQNTPESFARGIALLHEAIAIDPAEPLAYVGLAEGYITLGHGGAEQAEAFQRARAAAEQALKLDPDRAEAVAILADVALYHEWDWAKAERLFQRAFELNSSLAMTRYHHAWYLALFDRLDEAIAEHQLARDLDPLRALNTGWLGGLYVFAGRFDDAIVEARKALELSQTFAPSYHVLRSAYSRKGMHQEAIAAARRYVGLNPSAGGVQLVTAYAMAGRRDEALKVLSTLDPSAAGPTPVALMHLSLGDAEAALSWLEACYEARRATLPWIRTRGNGLEPLRDEPRFRELLRKMNLPL